MNIIIVIAVALSAFLLVAVICCMAVLNPPKEYIGALGVEEETVIGKEGETL